MRVRFEPPRTPCLFGRPRFVPCGIVTASSDVPEEDSATTFGDPLATGESILLHRRWVFDYNDDTIGGFAMGEFLLRDDGRLFIRYGGDIWAAGEVTYEYSPWKEDRRWHGTSVTGFIGWATDFGYGLDPPSPVPVDQTEAGPVSDGA